MLALGLHRFAQPRLWSHSQLSPRRVSALPCAILARSAGLTGN